MDKPTADALLAEHGYEAPRLIESAMRAMRPRSYKSCPRWVAVMDTFATGSTMAHAQAAHDRDRYRAALEKLARLGNGDHYGNSIGNEIAIRAITQDPQPWCLLILVFIAITCAPFIIPSRRKPKPWDFR